MKLVGNSNRRVAKLKTLSAFGETVNKQGEENGFEGRTEEGISLIPDGLFARGQKGSILVSFNEPRDSTRLTFDRFPSLELNRVE